MSYENKNKPALDLLHVVENEDGKPFFQKLGAMFPSKKGDTYLVVFNYMPASFEKGRVIAQPPKPKAKVVS